ncbi:hypothetical protein ACSYGW_06935 [Bacillus glycinifermentans]|uniref:hypothetical protein n=1 Tax=Bacillus glycinifermentans TaxID=1664069 RepID=UPI004059B725
MTTAANVFEYGFLLGEGLLPKEEGKETTLAASSNHLKQRRLLKRNDWVKREGKTESFSFKNEVKIEEKI